MNNQERLELINQRLDILKGLNLKLDKIIKLLEVKNNSDPLITFVKANKNADDSFIIDRTREIFNSLDHRE